MSTPEDRTGSGPDGGRHPDEQPSYGSPPYDPHAEYTQAQYQQGGYQQGGYQQAPHQQPGPGYGPPYGQAPYGAPGYGPPAGYAYGRPTNSLAIASLVLAFVFAPAGLITGIIARRQIRRTHEDGDGLALAGIVVGGIVTALFVLMIVLWIVAFVAFANEGFAP